MKRISVGAPEELYQLLMQLRSSGVPPPYLFVFKSDEEIIALLEACSEEDIERFTHDDVHLLIEQDGQFFRFTGKIGRKSTFETPPETIH